MTKDKEVCGCVVLKFERNDTQILLVSENGEVWGIPKGGLEPGEDPEAAAIRETLEETSISVKTIGFMGTLGRLSAWYALPLDPDQEPIPQEGEILAVGYHSVKKLPTIEARQVDLVYEAVERLRMASDV